MQPATLALVGIAIGVILQAGIQYLMVKNPGDVNGALLWLAGSLWGRGWEHVAAVAPWLLGFLPVACLLAYRLDILTLGDEGAERLGENVTGLRVSLLMTSVALAELVSRLSVRADLSVCLLRTWPGGWSGASTFGCFL